MTETELTDRLTLELAHFHGCKNTPGIRAAIALCLERALVSIDTERLATVEVVDETAFISTADRGLILAAANAGLLENPAAVGMVRRWEPCVVAGGPAKSHWHWPD